ncbi:MAG: hypothetical protein ACQGVK_01655 [Myxococcota bacterium]
MIRQQSQVRILATAVALWVAGPALAARVPDPSPYVLLTSRALRTPPVDAIPVCVPPSVDEALARRARAAGDYPESAGEMAAALRTDARRAGVEPGLLVAVLEARAAGTADAAREARGSLSRWRARDQGPASQACARLETARLELRLRRLPEAVAHARIAISVSGQIPGGQELQRAAEFYAAEGLYLAGRAEQSRAAYRRLSNSASARIAAAARLRFADSLFDAGQREGAQIEYEELLGGAEEFGASIEGWGLRALEANLEHGDLEAAKRWAEAVLAAEAPPEVRGAAQIRAADLLVARGNSAAARRLLEHIVESDAPAAVRATARLRIEHVDPEPADDERIERLRALTRDPWRPAADYARLLLGRDLLARGDAVGALDALTRVAFGPLADRLAGPLREGLDAALVGLAASATGPEGCASYVSSVGWRRRLLARRAGNLEPFALLGGCYATLGLEEVAIEAYREVSKRFGAEGVARVALPLARASLARGDIERARRAAIEHAGQDSREGDRWRLLLSEIEMFEGRYGTAAETLRRLVETNRPAAERTRAIVLLARAALHVGRLSELRFVIGDAILRLDPDERGPRNDWVGEAALMAADGHRAAGNLGAARDLYAIAVESLPVGERRDQAAYWLSELGGASPRRSAQEPPVQGAWKRLAETRQRIDALHRRIGRSVRSRPQP